MFYNDVKIEELRGYFEKYKSIKDVTQKDLNYLLNINIINTAVKKSQYEGLCEGKIYDNIEVLKYIPRIRHSWGVLYLCRCLICGDLFLVHCEKIVSNSYKSCYKDSCIQKCKIEKIQISGFTVPKKFTNNDILKIINFIDEKYFEVVNKNFKFLKCLGLDRTVKGNLYIKIQILCLKCNTVRECSYEHWKDKLETIACDGCDKVNGIVKVSTKDNIKTIKNGDGFNLRYKNKKSSKYIYLGKWRITDGKEKIWIQCRDCSYIMLVNGEDFLNDCIFDCYCNGAIEQKWEEKTVDLFSFFEGYNHYNDSLKGKVFGSDKILYKLENKHILLVECQKCGKTREVLEEEFLNERTRYFNLCSCEKSLEEPIKIGDRFGHLTVEYIDEKDIVLVCDCKNIVKYPLKSFIKSKNRFCSSHCTFPKFSSKYYDKALIGQRFNDFVVKNFLKRETFYDENSVGAYWLCECQKCGDVDSYSASEIVRGGKKSCCFGQKYYNSEYIGKVLNGVEILDIFKIKGNGLGTLWICKCPYCGDYFVSQPTFIVDESVYHCGCQSKTKGELAVEYFLNELKLDKDYGIYYQYTFNDLVSDKNAKLRYDFALVNKKTNAIYLIEYDGPQHDDINSVIGAKSLEEAKEILERTQKNDLIKNIYALKNNYPLLRIKNIKSRKLIEDKIFNFLRQEGVI